MHQLTKLRLTTLCAALCLALTAASDGASAECTVYRDRWGVPSIVARDMPEAAYGLGYVMANDDAERMALNFKQARGRTAEIEGRKALFADGFMQSLGFEEMARDEAGKLDPATAAIIQRFCDGANRALAEQKGRIPGWIEPFTPTDVLAMAQLTNAAFALLDVANRLLPGFGSNQFAVAPSRSATGHALLSIDPHLTWDGLMAWYEFALYTPEVQFRGITLPGLPFGVMGHTDHVAWCMTNNDPDLYTIYTVKTNPANPKQYDYYGTWRDFEDVTFELRYRDTDGTMKTSRSHARRTAFGPMVPFSNRAVRLTMAGSWALLGETQQMARARNAAQFRAALRPLGLSMWNIVYADTAGHIGYQYNARVPHKDAAVDWSKPVSGSDPHTQWGPLWTLDELPHIENPTSGLLVNCNSAPWLTTLDEEMPANRWPTYVTSYGVTTRYQRLSELLRPLHHVSSELAKTIATDTLVPYARQAVAALRAGFAHPDPAAEEALAVLSRWNGRADTDARGCALYRQWLLADKSMPAVAKKAASGGTWSAEESTAARAALLKAAATMKVAGLTPDAPWGAMHLGRRGSHTEPESGFGEVTRYDNAAAVVPNSGPLKDGRIVCNEGSSFRMVVDLDPRGVRSWSVLPYGESQDPHSPHYADQMPLFARGQYKETHFGLAGAKRSAVSTVVLRP